MLILTFYIRPYFNEHVPISTRAQPWYALACSCLWDTYNYGVMQNDHFDLHSAESHYREQYACNWHNFQCLHEQTTSIAFYHEPTLHAIRLCQPDSDLPTIVYTLRLMEVAWHKLRVRKHNCTCTIPLKKYRGRWLWAVYTLIESICMVKIM